MQQASRASENRTVEVIQKKILAILRDYRRKSLEIHQPAFSINV
jgi:hypothetical protein